MKSSEFLTALRTIIREEVTMAVRKEVRAMLSENTVPVQQEVYTPKPKTRNTTKFKDPMLNELLSGVSPMQSDYSTQDEWPTLNYNTKAKAGLPNVFSKTGPINAAPEGVNIAALEEKAPEVAAALTKDYRSLMKAIDKRKGVSN